MLHFFDKRSDHIKTIDKIALSQNAKWENCLLEWSQNKNIVFIAWFDETLDSFKNYTSAQIAKLPEAFLAGEIQFVHIHNNPVIFLEHFPVYSKELAVFEKLHLKEAIVYSSLDEPFFKHIGSEKITQLMQTLGMKENEILQHNMISASIKRMQKKIEEKISIEQSARSQQQWMNANIST